MDNPMAGYRYTVSMASGATLSTAISLPGAFTKMMVEIHTMASGTDVYFQGSHDGVTYRRMWHDTTITNTSPGPFYLASSATNCHVDINHLTTPFVKVELSTAMTATTACFRLYFA